MNIRDIQAAATDEILELVEDTPAESIDELIERIGSLIESAYLLGETETRRLLNQRARRGARQGLRPR